MLKTESLVEMNHAERDEILGEDGVVLRDGVAGGDCLSGSRLKALEIFTHYSP